MTPDAADPRSRDRGDDERPAFHGTFVDAFTNFARHIVSLASWALALACVCALMSRLAVPLFPEDVTTRGLLLLSPLTLGACIGKRIDKRIDRRRIDRRLAARKKL